MENFWWIFILNVFDDEKTEIYLIGESELTIGKAKLSFWSHKKL